jgi:hypothetical protein
MPGGPFVVVDLAWHCTRPERRFGDDEADNTGSPTRQLMPIPRPRFRLQYGCHLEQRGLDEHQRVTITMTAESEGESCKAISRHISGWVSEKPSRPNLTTKISGRKTKLGEAGAGFPLDRNGRIGGGHDLDVREHLLQRSALSNDFLKLVRRADLVLEIALGRG